MSRFLLLILALILCVAPADARRKKKSAPKPPEEWPEEVPDYDLNAPAEEAIMNDFRKTATLTDDQLVEHLMQQPIMGRAEIDADALCRFILRNNPSFNPEIAQAYLKVGERYGVRGDIALCQSILETGWFKFSDGTAVTPDQHNYCGLGVTKRGLRGHSFETIEQGVTAQIQHLYAYACSSPIPDGETILDPRFKLVNRGVAPTWADLAGRWAANDRYARSIMRLFVQVRKFISSTE